MDARTTIATTVHDLQVLSAAIPMTAHDVPVDLIATPTRVLHARRVFARPRRIRWTELDATKLAAMPPLATLRAERGARE